MNFTYVLGFVVLRDVVKVFFVCEKDDRGESSTKSLGGMTRPKDEMGSQNVFSEFDILHSSDTCLSKSEQQHPSSSSTFSSSDSSGAWISSHFRIQVSYIRWRVRGAREAAAPRDSLNFRQASLLSRNEFESGTFTIVLHATSSFTYVSVIYGANFSFKPIKHHYATPSSSLFSSHELFSYPSPAEHAHISSMTF